MTEATAGRNPVNSEDDEASVLALASVLLRWRRTIVVLAVLGAAIGSLNGLTSTRVYVSATTFIPQGSESAISGFAAAAGQFGIRVPTSGGSTWGPPVYVELLRSTALLEPVALDTVAVAEQGGRRVAVMDLLKIKAPTGAERLDATVTALKKIITVGEVRNLSAVRLSAATPWPSVSRALVEKLLLGVNRFNMESRKSQAAAERQFVEAQAAEAESALRAAEEKLEDFLQGNKMIGNSPVLATAHERLQREVSLRQQVYVSLLQNREEARIREVRDTPVITVLEAPRLPIVGEPRGSIQKGFLGGLAGGIIGVFIAFLMRGLQAARTGHNEAAREFFDLLREVTPRFLKRRGSL